MFLVAASGLFGVAFPLVVAPIFRGLTEQLTATPSRLGAILLGGWVPASLGALPLVLLGVALGVRQGVGRRRVLLLLAFALTVVESVVLLLGMYGLLYSAVDAAGTAH